MIKFGYEINKATRPRDCRTRTTKRTSNGRELERAGTRAGTSWNASWNGRVLRREASDRDRAVWRLVAD
ncbi:hypothetical protein F2Q68_00026758 [Brassica cretica]|uniref:Uncharacterized protein n=1 Tax=Brassica cretica TaxID=69181 RepID=A0A8S9IFZ2_BRACR|nr:hypothetical protein F2Q68_00026758 [Brassica cretica]